MKKYDNYKNSGVEWLGEIPEHWKVKRLKYIFEILKRISGELGHEVLSITQTGIKIKDINSGEGQLSMDYSKYQLVFEGDFAMNHMDLLTGYVDVSKYNGVISPDYRVFNIINTTYSKDYLLLLLQLCYKNKVFYAHGQGVSMLGRWRFPAENFNNFSFPIPPLSEQTTIAHFLDDNTTKIDQAIAIKQQQIALLQERRQILIHKAVTRGLNENVKLKDSGVEWIGEIPENWQLKNLKFLKANIKNAFVDGPFGSNLKSEHFIENGEVYVVESGFITTGVFINKTFKTISEKHYQTIKRSTCSEKDVIIAKIGANYGMAAELPLLDKKAVVSGNSLKITLDNKKVLNNLFVKLLGLSKQLGGFEDIVNASAQPALSLGGLNNLKLPIAPIEEQPEISRYIENLEQKIATTISLKEQEIEKLKEYKMSLIDGAVTGKVKVF